MARSNYQFNKRQKELARKQKKEEKRRLKLEKNTVQPIENEDRVQSEGTSPADAANPEV